MFEDLKGRKAVITGSTSGIGLSFAEALGSMGVDITLNGFGDQDEIEENRARIAGHVPGSCRSPISSASKPKRAKSSAQNCGSSAPSVIHCPSEQV